MPTPFLSPMLLGLLLSFIVSSSALAAPESTALAETLKSRAGSAVTLRLSSGQELTGKLKMVGQEAVMLEELTGREFFDAVIPVDKIEALIVRRPAQ